jgi:uncharacterized protein (TIGR00288 family)
MKESDFSNVVVLIDSENISAKYLKKIFESIAVYGRIAVKRIYADWTNNQSNNWKELLQEYSLIPIQQFNNVSFKNVSDFTLVIDAMDLVHEDMFDCFCIVSSDSDFTRLAQRIREKGRFVIGLGENKASRSFINACNSFVFLDDKKVEEVKIAEKENIKIERPDNTESVKINNSEELVATALSVLADNDGWVMLSKVVPYIKRIQPEFELSDMNVGKLSDYFDKKKYEIKKPNDPNPGPVYIRKK